MERKSSTTSLEHEKSLVAKYYHKIKSLRLPVRNSIYIVFSAYQLIRYDDDKVQQPFLAFYDSDDKWIGCSDLRNMTIDHPDSDILKKCCSPEAMQFHASDYDSVDCMWAAANSRIQIDVASHWTVPGDGSYLLIKQHALLPNRRFLSSHHTALHAVANAATHATTGLKPPSISLPSSRSTLASNSHATAPLSKTFSYSAFEASQFLATKPFLITSMDIVHGLPLPSLSIRIESLSMLLQRRVTLLQSVFHSYVSEQRNSERQMEWISFFLNQYPEFADPDSNENVWTYQMLKHAICALHSQPLLIEQLKSQLVPWWLDAEEILLRYRLEVQMHATPLSCITRTLENLLPRGILHVLPITDAAAMCSEFQFLSPTAYMPYARWLQVLTESVHQLHLIGLIDGGRITKKTSGSSGSIAGDFSVDYRDCAFEYESTTTTDIKCRDDDHHATESLPLSGSAASVLSQKRKHNPEFPVETQYYRIDCYSLAKYKYLDHLLRFLAYTSTVASSSRALPTAFMDKTTTKTPPTVVSSRVQVVSLARLCSQWTLHVPKLQTDIPYQLYCYKLPWTYMNHCRPTRLTHHGHVPIVNALLRVPPIVRAKFVYFTRDDAVNVIHSLVRTTTECNVVACTTATFGMLHSPLKMQPCIHAVVNALSDTASGMKGLVRSKGYGFFQLSSYMPYACSNSLLPYGGRSTTSIASKSLLGSTKTEGVEAGAVGATATLALTSKSAINTEHAHSSYAPQQHYPPTFDKLPEIEELGSYMPLCLRRLHHNIAAGNHIKHADGRLPYVTKLVHLGYSVTAIIDWVMKGYKQDPTDAENVRSTITRAYKTHNGRSPGCASIIKAEGCPHLVRKEGIAKDGMNAQRSCYRELQSISHPRPTAYHESKHRDYISHPEEYMRIKRDQKHIKLVLEVERRLHDLTSSSSSSSSTSSSSSSSSSSLLDSVTDSYNPHTPCNSDFDDDLASLDIPM
jgi:hypothetical protein